MATWKDTAREHQQQYLKLSESGAWDVRRSESKKLLAAKVGLVVYGPPPYSRGQEQNINTVTDAIISEGGGGGLLASLVVVKPNGGGDYYCHPVFRVGCRRTFVDCIGRVYSGWADFLSNNQLPESDICYPEDGVYSRDARGWVRVDFGQVKRSDLIKVTDVVNDLFTIFSLGVDVAKALDVSVDPDLDDFVAKGKVVSEVYGTAREAYKQLDRDSHGQTSGNWAAIGNRASAVGRRSSTISAARVIDVASRVATYAGETREEMLRDIRGEKVLFRGDVYMVADW